MRVCVPDTPQELSLALQSLQPPFIGLETTGEVTLVVEQARLLVLDQLEVVARIQY